MPAADSRSAEISRIKNKLVEVEAVLKEQKKISGKLKETHEKKEYEVVLIDKEIAAELEGYNWRKARLENTIKNCIDEATTKIKQYNALENELTVDTAGFDVLERENERLNRKFKELLQERDSLTQIHKEEIEKRNVKDFTTRMNMEKILRQVIKSNDKNYNKDAIEKMVYEASLADTENLKIRSEFSMRERQTTELIKKQEASLELLKKVTIERELTESSANYQRLEVQKILAVNTELKLQNVALEDSVKQLEQEIVDMEIKLDRQKHLAAELKRLQTNLKNQKAENKKLVESTVELGQKILRETLALSDTLRANYSIKVSKMIAEESDFS